MLIVFLIIVTSWVSDYLIDKTYKTNLAVMYSLHYLHQVIGIAKLVWKNMIRKRRKE